MKYKNNILESPTPTLCDVLHLFYSNNSFDKLKLFCSDSKKDIYFFSRGTWAIAAFIRWFSDAADKKELFVFLPDYFCDLTLQELRQENIKLNFYPIRENLSPNWNAVEEQTKKFGPPDIFILVHYFGFPCGAEETYDYCRDTGTVLLEDCAHVICPTPSIGRKAHAAVYSPHKTLGVPDGGLLVVDKNKLTELLNRDLKEFFDTLLRISSKPSTPLAKQFFWVLKKMVQRLCFILNISWKRAAAARHDLTNPSSIKKVYGMSITTKRLMAVYQRKLKLFEQRRRENYLMLNEAVLKVKKIIQPLFKNLPSDAVPYFYPMFVEPEYVEQLYLALNNNKIPAGSWPDLPEEVINSPQQHKIAVKMRRSIITLPIHHALSKKHIARIARVLQTQVGKLTN